jgi:glycosyltransferase involved in cell wall biosynthesis
MAPRLRSVRVRGPYGGPTGYDHHVREFVRHLRREAVEVELIDMPEWTSARLPQATADLTAGAPASPAQVALEFCMPHQVLPDAVLPTVNYTMFEATRIHPAWVAACEGCTLVVLPTESSRQAWLDSGAAADKLRLCPLGIDDQLFSKPALPLPLTLGSGEPLLNFRTRFLNLCELGPRENVLGLIRVWLRATNAGDDAVLILKIGSYAAGWTEEFLAKLQQLQVEVGRRLPQAAPMQLFINHFLPDEDMPRLYALATHYVSVSHGEGWDQPMAEAGAAGLELIAPNHSAYQAYLDDEVAWLIPAHEVPAVFPGGADTGMLFRNANWWQPDEDAAVDLVRAAIKGTLGPRRSARQRLLGDFSWRAATDTLLGILEEAAYQASCTISSRGMPQHT